ncbi:unnamed protein product [Calypogeia fissa]
MAVWVPETDKTFHTSAASLRKLTETERESEKRNCLSAEILVVYVCKVFGRIMRSGDPGGIIPNLEFGV